jgi:hypothetical protein
MVPGQQGQKVSELFSQRISQAWWYILIIPATQEVVVEGSRSKADLDQKCETLPEKQLGKKG